MSDTVSALEQQRASLLQQISQLPDLRPGSITGPVRCGSPIRHARTVCRPGHSPHPGLTYNTGRLQKVFSAQLLKRKTLKQEIAAFRDYQQLSRRKP